MSPANTARRSALAPLLISMLSASSLALTSGAASACLLAASILSTIDESGVPGYDVATWIGAFAPAGTPKAIVDKIEAAIRQALATPDVKAKLEALSMEVRSGASAELRAVLAGDMGKWGRLVREQNIRIAQ